MSAAVGTVEAGLCCHQATGVCWRERGSGRAGMTTRSEAVETPCPYLGTGHDPASAAWRLQSLTEREREGLLLLGADLRNKQLAQELGIADRTVKAHIANFVGGGVRSGRRRGPGPRSCRLSPMTRCVTTRRARDTNPRYRAATGGLSPHDGAACARSVPGAGAGPAGPVPLYGRRSQRESVESAPVRAELAPYRPNSLPNESDSPQARRPGSPQAWRSHSDRMHGEVCAIGAMRAESSTRISSGVLGELVTVTSVAGARP